MSTLDTLLLFVSSCVACRTAARGRKCRWPSGVDFTTRVAIVTGASSGVGYGVAQELVSHGWRVVMAGRDEVRLLESRKKIMSQKPLGQAIILGTLDLSDLESVRCFAGAVLDQKQNLPVCLLVNAAGILRRNLHRCEGTNMEEMVATNAVGPMLLTELLLPLLDETALRTGVSSRVINVASSCHTFLGVKQQKNPLDMLADIHPAPIVSDSAEAHSNAERSGQAFTLWNFVGYYGLSKLCVIWWTSVLARRCALRFIPVEEGSHRLTNNLRVIVACCHPGIIATRLYRDLIPRFVLDYVVYYPSLIIGKTWTEGAQAVLRLCVEEQHPTQGGYYLCSGDHSEKSGLCCLSNYAMDMDAAQKFCSWANDQIELQRSKPPVKKLSPRNNVPRRLMTVNLL